METENRPLCEFPELRQFCCDSGVEESGIASATFVGWDHAESLVWQLKRGSATVFLKSHRQKRKFEQERFAYENWLPHFSREAVAVPSLLAVRGQSPYALLLSAVDGEIVESSLLKENAEANVYQQAGGFLARLHRISIDDQDIDVATAMQMRMEQWSHRAGEYVDVETTRWVKAQIEQALPGLATFRRVPCHRDFTPRNWLVDKMGRLGVIDFEHSRADLWFLDVQRIWSEQWPQRPDLEEAFWEGYGRQPTYDEQELLRRCSALSALSTIVWSREHEDSKFEQKGWSLLSRLQAIET